MKKVVRAMLIAFLSVLIVIIVYNIWDNQRVIVVKQEIEIENLPSELVGLSILQVTDLHEKVFGSNQKKLIEAVNSETYDVIVFTGDMLSSPTSVNYQPFYSLIEAIKNKDHALYVKGNADPENYFIDSRGNYVKDEFIEGMEQRGVKLLESAYTLNIGEAKLRFVDFELSIQDPEKEPVVAEGRVKPKYAFTEQYKAHQRGLMEETASLEKLADEDVLIALNHYPVVDKRMNELLSNSYFNFRDYDLIMAGHYHGGQIRLPMIGALFVPEPWYENGGFFPPQDRVKGLWEYKNVKQYVSAGLGYSNVNFRLFNTPEINLLTLKEK
ncbi:metallophosphoesterase [Halobacillus amylolyticus]|uniref:Metallophosphoesterase n=1 Tax=Halobacillus amylolyticus TaxID=2932259 RepID=A0ABY4HGI9_9BACI|nr:metallophosphoesterase [Halobacillus amylolyticus]UOR13772.1 metallophosphoesterase [Halobacillus amylolyticus]